MGDYRERRSRIASRVEKAPEEARLPSDSFFGSRRMAYPHYSTMYQHEKTLDDTRYDAIRMIYLFETPSDKRAQQPTSSGSRQKHFEEKYASLFKDRKNHEYSRKYYYPVDDSSTKICEKCKQKETPKPYYMNNSSSSNHQHHHYKTTDHSLNDDTDDYPYYGTHHDSPRSNSSSQAGDDDSLAANAKSTSTYSRSNSKYERKSSTSPTTSTLSSYSYESGKYRSSYKSSRESKNQPSDRYSYQRSTSKYSSNNNMDSTSSSIRRRDRDLERRSSHRETEVAKPAEHHEDVSFKSRSDEHVHHGNQHGHNDNVDVDHDDKHESLRNHSSSIHIDIHRKPDEEVADGPDSQISPAAEVAYPKPVEALSEQEVIDSGIDSVAADVVVEPVEEPHEDGDSAIPEAHAHHHSGISIHATTTNGNVHVDVEVSTEDESV